MGGEGGGDGEVHSKGLVVQGHSMGPGWHCANGKGTTGAEKISGIKLRGFGNFLGVAGWFIM